MAYKNKEDQKAASRRHYLKNKEKIIEKSKQRRLSDPQKHNEYNRKWYNKTSDIEGVSVGVLQRRKYVANNQEQYKLTNKEWRDNNKEHISEYNRKYWQENKQKIKLNRKK